MTNKSKEELIDLAGIALSITNAFNIERNPSIENKWVEMYKINTWDPTKDDAICMRLMISLGMEVYVDNHPDGCMCVEVKSRTYPSGEVILSFDDDDDTYMNDYLYKASITREAIVLMASLIGEKVKAMLDQGHSLDYIKEKRSLIFNQ